MNATNLNELQQITMALEMDNTTDITLLIDKLIQKNCSFAVWAAPGTNTPELIISKEETVFHKQLDLNNESGFIFAPYESTEETPLILLKPDIYLSGYEAISKYDVNNIPNNKKVNKRFASHFVIKKEAYLTDIEKTIDFIKESNLSKAIFSRIIPEKRENESLGKLFCQLVKQTPNAFVYLTNLQAGLWMGATPEILLKSEDDKVETVSLAGTQQRRKGEYAWFTKDIEEQAFVSRYLVEIFYRFNIFPYTTVGPITLESGKVAHLATSFQFDKGKIAGKMSELITELHPTPAVCGFPKTTAKDFIHTIEKHDRRYYSGFLGPWRLNNATRLFVNLRCMEITDDNFMLYSGGGITARSIPEDEWEETNNKAKTLLSALEIIRQIKDIL